MMRIAAIIGSASPESATRVPTLPMSDRGAIALALARFAGDVRAYAADAGARCFARAAGVETVEEVSGSEMGAADVVLIGRGGCADRGDLLPARLAEENGAALVYDVIDVQRESDRLLVTRDLGRGARDLLSVRGRAVLVVAESIERGPYVSRYRMNAAQADSDESAARKEQNCVEWEPVTPRVRLGDHAARVAGSAVERMNTLFGAGQIAENTASLVRGSAEECARHLLRYLSHHGFVERRLGGEWESASDEAARSQPTAQRLPRSAEGAASIPIRAQRRPRPVDERPLAMRGPFEVGVDI
jgi:electron transfer flavoprotein alpha/beta subunit